MNIFKIRRQANEIMRRINKSISNKTCYYYDDIIIVLKTLAFLGLISKKTAEQLSAKVVDLSWGREV